VAGTCGYGKGLLGSINVGNFLTSCKVYWLASQEGLCSMGYVSNYNMHYFVKVCQFPSQRIMQLFQTLFFGMWKSNITYNRKVCHSDLASPWWHHDPTDIEMSSHMSLPIILSRLSL